MDYPLLLQAEPGDAGCRLDQFLVSHLPGVSRSRIQQLVEVAQITVNGTSARASLKLRGNERVEVMGPPEAPPLRAIAEDIPLDVVFEDEHLAVINKPAGMMVHAGAGATDAARNRGTLVNALLHRFGSFSTGNDALRPGIVHRLDKQTSGLIIVAKNDAAHRRLAEQFATRKVHKTYLTLVHGWLKLDNGTIQSPVDRDPKRRTRMAAGRGRSAVSHYHVLKRIAAKLGKFSLVEVRIETGRTHQIRVHLASLGHPVVGDTLYGAPAKLRGQRATAPTLARNFLHAAAIEFIHPVTHAPIRLKAALPAELEDFLARVSN